VGEKNGAKSKVGDYWYCVVQVASEMHLSFIKAACSVFQLFYATIFVIIDLLLSSAS
jgi:hypothetical protein